MGPRKLRTRATLPIWHHQAGVLEQGAVEDACWCGAERNALEEVYVGLDCDEVRDHAPPTAGPADVVTRRANVRRRRTTRGHEKREARS